MSIRPGQKALIVDPSSSHLAYCIMNFTNEEAEIIEVGMVWCADWPLGRKFHYIINCLQYLTLYHNVSHIRTESFFAPFRQQAGTTVIPALNHMMRAMSYSIEKESRTFISVEEISPTSWRKTLGVFGIKDAKGKKDYKEPTKFKVEQYLGKIFPETVISNVTLNPRTTTNDIGDVLAIGLSVAVELRYSKISIKKDAFNNLKTIKVLNSMV